MYTLLDVREAWLSDYLDRKTVSIRDSDGNIEMFWTSDVPKLKLKLNNTEREVIVALSVTGSKGDRLIHSIVEKIRKSDSSPTPDTAL